MSAPSSDIANNRKARREYHILDTFETGIELKGTEVKSIRLGKINIRDAFARVEKGQVFLHGCDIQPYEQASHTQHEAKRPRRLLLHRKEITELHALTEVKGHTLVALRAYWKNRRVKIEIGVARGKQHHDKREDLKKRVQDREVAREVARFNRQ
jgi:SsrA-binding protein